MYVYQHPMEYPEFISRRGRQVKPCLVPQNFSNYDGDSLSPPEGKAAQGVRPLDPRLT